MYELREKDMDYIESDGGRICKSFKDDCVVRSISVAMGREYRDVFTDLMAAGLDVGAYPNHPKVWERYLKDNGWIKNKPPRDTAGRMIKLRDWDCAPEFAVVKNSGHLTAIRRGIVVDTWDCRYRPVNSYWTQA